MKTTKLIAWALLIVLLVGIGTAAASPLRVYAYSQATGKSVSNTQICASVVPNSNPSRVVWTQCGNTNTGNYAFEVPSQYTGQSYTLTVSAKQSSLRISNSYVGRFKTSVTLAMR